MMGLTEIPRRVKEWQRPRQVAAMAGSGQLPTTGRAWFGTSPGAVGNANSLPIMNPITEYPNGYVR
jgi:hypothetical protein